MKKGTGNKEKGICILQKNKLTVNQSRMFAMGKEQGTLGDLQLAKNKNNQAVNKS